MEAWENNMKDALEKRNLLPNEKIWENIAKTLPEEKRVVKFSYVKWASIAAIFIGLIVLLFWSKINSSKTLDNSTKIADKEIVTQKNKDVESNPKSVDSEVKTPNKLSPILKEKRISFPMERLAETDHQKPLPVKEFKANTAIKSSVKEEDFYRKTAKETEMDQLLAKANRKISYQEVLETKNNHLTGVELLNEMQSGSENIAAKSKFKQSLEKGAEEIARYFQRGKDD